MNYQSKESLDMWYMLPDPWGYESNKDDIARKTTILGSLESGYKRALDIGAGEGFITKDLPAEEIHAIEFSDNASSRLPKHIKRVQEPKGEYDLIIATGVLYPQYNYLKMHQWIQKHAIKTVLTCNIKEWEIPLKGNQITYVEFPYREYTQALRIYDFTA